MWLDVIVAGSPVLFIFPAIYFPRFKSRDLSCTCNGERRQTLLLCMRFTRNNDETNKPSWTNYTNDKTDKDADDR